MLTTGARAHGAAQRWDDDYEDPTRYAVVVDDEERYSIWPADRERPLGWYFEGFQGTKRECIVHIEEVWTDMRPKSIRDRVLP